MQAFKSGRRKEALYILRRGWLSLGETAATVNASRQIVRYWATQAGFDYHARRKAFIRRCKERATNGNRKG